MEEIFVDIKGFEGLYQISNLGRVKSLSRPSLPKVRAIPLPIRFIKVNISLSGYAICGLSKDGQSTMLFVHRLIALHFIPNPEEKPYVNHIDGVKSNYNIENLEWVTPKENAAHASRIGLLKRKSATERLSFEIAEKIRVQKPYYTVSKLAEMYNVRPITIYNVLNYTTWKKEKEVGRPRKTETK